MARHPKYNEDEKKRVVEIFIKLNKNLRATARKTELAPNTIAKWVKEANNEPIPKQVTKKKDPDAPVPEVIKKADITPKIEKNITKTIEIESEFVVKLADLKTTTIKRLMDLVPNSKDIEKLTFLLKTIGDLEKTPEGEKGNSTFNFIQNIQNQILKSQENAKKNIIVDGDES